MGVSSLSGIHGSSQFPRSSLALTAGSMPLSENRTLLPSSNKPVYHALRIASAAMPGFW